MSTRTWSAGDRVQVSLPYGSQGDRTVHQAEIERVGEAGKWNYVKVRFDDPLIYGGLGWAWVSPGCLAGPGEDPAPPERLE